MDNNIRTLLQFKDNLPQSAKNALSVLQRYRPDLFEEKQDILQTQTEQALSPLQKAYKSAIDKSAQLKLADLIEKDRQDLMEKGYLPDTRETNWLGDIKKQISFPFQKMLYTIGALARTPAAIQQQVQQKAMADPDYKPISQFDLSSYDVKDQMGKNINPMNAIKSLTGIGGKGWKEVAKATFEPIYNLKSKYRGFGFDVPNTELLEGTAINRTVNEQIEPYLDKWKEGNALQRAYAKFAENVLPDEGGNWWQRLTSGFAGTPLDVISLGEDVLFDLSTYASGGFAKGAKTGISLSDDLIKSGTKVLPKGAEIGLTKAGRAAFKTAKTTKWGRLFEGLKSGKLAPSVVKGVTGTDDIARQTALNILESRALNKFLQQAPDAITLNKYIDFGGTKLFGQTIIPGYKYAQKFGKLKNKNVAKVLGKLFDENADIPNDLVPFKNWLLAAGDAETDKFIDDFAKIVAKSSNSDLDKVQKYLWLKADLERNANRLAQATGAQAGGMVNPVSKAAEKTRLNRLANIYNKYDEAIKGLNLNKEQLKTANKLADFWQGVGKQFSESTGKPLDLYEFYTPIRYKKTAEQIGKTSLLGAVDQPFSQQRKMSMLQAEKLGLQPEDLVNSSIKRLYEQKKNVFRSRLINETKGFISDTAKPGYVKIDGIPELAGKYIPQEYEKVLKNATNLFFGDDAFKKSMMVYDRALLIWKRWALASPGYHFRNFYTDLVSGLLEYGIGYLNPKAWGKGMKILKGSDDMVNIGKVTKKASAWRRELQETGELVTQTSVEAQLGKKSFGKLGKVDDAIAKVSPAEWSLKFGNTRENVGRVVAGVIERQEGSSKIMAAANVKKVFFDYLHSLTPFEKNVMKRVAPFYTWLKNNMRRQVELLFTRTGRYATIPKAMNFVENISGVNVENYKEFRPEYQEDLGMIATPLRQPGLPDWLADLLGRQRTTKAGNMLAFNPNFAFQEWSRLNPKDLVSATSPFFKELIQQLTNYDIFFESPIHKKGTTKYMKLARGLKIGNFDLSQETLGKLSLDQLEKMSGGLLSKDSEGNILIHKRLDHALKSLVPSYGMSARMFPSGEGTDNTPYQTLSTLGGIKFTLYDEEKEKEKYYENFKEKADELLKDYQIKNYTPDQIEAGLGMPDLGQQKSAAKDIYMQYLDDKYKDILELKEVLKVVGSSKEIDAFVKEQLAPYEEEKKLVQDKNLDELIKILNDIGIDLNMIDIEQIVAQKKAGK